MFSKFVLITLLFGTVGLAQASTPPPEAFQIRHYDTQTLANGMTIMWLPDPALPYVSMDLMIRSGSAQDPSGKEGLANFTASMLERGTTKRTASQISEDLEQIGTSFGTSVEPDYSMVSVSSLAFYKDNTLKQFGELVFQPSFTNAELERLRKQSLGGLQKLADHAEAFAEYLMPAFMYGKHPYGHESVGTPRAVKGLKRVDLQRFYSANYTPDNSVLAVIGQFDDKFKEDVLNLFNTWKVKSSAVHQEVPDFPQWKGRELLLVDRSDLNQAQIEIGFKGVPRNMPEYLELRAALKILGESFGSRLFDEIRVKRGLTYHISAWFDPRLKPGPMGIYTFTRVDKIGETVQETLNTYKKFVKEGVTDAEVNDVKALMRGQFPRNFETPEALAKQLLILNRYGVSADYLTHYLTNLQAVTKDSVNAAIRKYFDTDNLRILVYAPKSKAEETMKGIGQLEIKNYRDFLQ